MSKHINTTCKTAVFAALAILASISQDITRHSSLCLCCIELGERFQHVQGLSRWAMKPQVPLVAEFHWVHAPCIDCIGTRSSIISHTIHNSQLQILQNCKSSIFFPCSENIRNPNLQKAEALGTSLTQKPFCCHDLCFVSQSTWFHMIPYDLIARPS